MFYQNSLAQPNMLPTFIAVVLSFLAIASSSPLEERNTCNRDNVLRCLVSASAIATPYCSSTLSLGVVTSYTGTTTPISYVINLGSEKPVILTQRRTATDTITVTVTSPAAKVKRGSGPQTTIYAGSPITVVGPGTTSAVLNRRTVEARATTSPAPGCLAQYSPAPSRVTSACNCLSITSSTLSIVSIAPATTAVSTVF